jgi:hypothetical protein
MIILLTWPFFALIVGILGSSRSIGFWLAFILSLILSPLVGFIIVICSRPNSQINFENALMSNIVEKNRPSHADVEAKLERILDMKNKGLISEREYNLMRKEIMAKILA